MTSGSVFLTSAHAIYRDSEEILDCEGGVTLRDTARVVIADRVTYDIKKRRVSASESVEFQGRRYILRASEVSYEQDIRSLVAKQDVYLEDTEKQIVLTGDQIVYNEHEILQQQEIKNQVTLAITELSGEDQN